MTTPVFSTATAEVIAQITKAVIMQLETVRAEGDRLARVLAILQDGAAPPAPKASRGIMAAIQEPTAPAPAVELLTAWQRRKAREAARDGAKAEGRPKTRKGRRTATKVRRPQNDQTLGAVLIALLQRKAPRTTDELANAAIASGYNTVSNNFKQVAYMLLRKDTKTFRKGADGSWTLTKAAANG